MVQSASKALTTPLSKPLTQYHQVLSELSPEQHVAATSNALSSLVLAGAGTGKTRVLIARLAYLYDVGYFEAATVLMLAFARKAAIEMQERIEHLLPKLSARVEVSTFHSLGLHIVSQVNGSTPKLTELSDSEALSRFIRQCFFKLCAQHEYYLSAYFKWLSFSSINNKSLASLRSLNDEYVQNRAELICANLLYQLDIDYFYKPHYVHSHQWTKYESYRPSFYLIAEKIYLEVYPLSKNDLDQPQLEERQKRLAIHSQYQTTLLELFVESSLEVFYEQTYMELCQLALKSYRAPRTALRLGRSAYHHEELIEHLCRYLPLFKHELQWPDLELLLGADGRLFNALLEPIWSAYQIHLKSKGTIDFEQMIVMATEYVRAGIFKVPWDEVMIDEFQDISANRADLIQAIREQRPDIRLFCVGDDWQAIYRFAGSDLRFVTHFEQYFGQTQRYALSHTYRFGEALSRESSRFVLQNPLQSRKSLFGHKGHKNPLILCPLEQISQKQWLVSVLEVILKDCGAKQNSVLILSRFRHFLPSVTEMRSLNERFPSLDILQGTVHGVKGNEADYVVLIEVNQGEFGFPSEKSNDPLVERYLPESEGYPYAEERRLFYVALTRTRQQVYLVYSEEKASTFINELKAAYEHLYLKDLIKRDKESNKAKRKSWSKLSFF